MTSTNRAALWAQRPCRVGDPERWFATKIKQQRAAQRECGRCPVLAECAARALALAEQGELPLYCVIASVLTPTFKSGPEKFDAALARLREVAATGRPAPVLTGFTPKEQGPGPASDPQLRAMVCELRESGMSWEDIGAQLGHPGEVVRSAWRSATGDRSKGAAA